MSLPSGEGEKLPTFGYFVINIMVHLRLSPLFHRQIDPRNEIHALKMYHFKAEILPKMKDNFLFCIIEVKKSLFAEKFFRVSILTNDESENCAILNCFSLLNIF